LKSSTITALSLGFFSVITGYLLSGISFIGRTGVNLVYTEYKFLKTWWKGAILIYVVWSILFFIQSYLSRKAGNSTAKLINIVALLIAVGGLYFSYSDFRNSLSHRLLGERFHLGVYLFWLGWMAISIVLLLAKKPAKTTIGNGAKL
jgi:hypothetical protein